MDTRLSMNGCRYEIDLTFFVQDIDIDPRGGSIDWGTVFEVLKYLFMGIFIVFRIKLSERDEPLY